MYVLYSIVQEQVLLCSVLFLIMKEHSKVQLQLQKQIKALIFSSQLLVTAFLKHCEEMEHLGWFSSSVLFRKPHGKQTKKKDICVFCILPSYSDVSLIKIQ